MAAVAYSLLAAASWGVADFMAGLKSRRLGVLSVLLWVESSGALIALAAILVSGEPLPDGRTVAASAVAGAAGLCGLGLFYRALSIGTMSIVAPISATGVVLPVVVGLAGGDTLTAVVAAGLAVTVGGVLLASREEVEEVERRGPERPAALLAVGAAAGFGLYFVFADIAADGSVLWLLAIGRLAVLPGVAALVRRSGTPLPAPRERWQLVLIGGADLAATALYAVATTRGALSVVSVVGSLYPVMTILMARGVLGERLTRGQLAGVLAALAGVAMVSAG